MAVGCFRWCGFVLLLLWLPGGSWLRLPEEFGVEVRKLFVEVGRDGLGTVKLMGDFRDVSAVSDLEILNDSFPFLANRVFLLRRQAKVMWRRLAGRQEVLLQCGLCALKVCLDDGSMCPRSIELISELIAACACS